MPDILMKRYLTDSTFRDPTTRLLEALLLKEISVISLPLVQGLEETVTKHNRMPP
jgi:hypothetical protein